MWMKCDTGCAQTYSCDLFCVCALFAVLWSCIFLRILSVRHYQFIDVCVLCTHSQRSCLSPLTSVKCAAISSCERCTKERRKEIVAMRGMLSKWMKKYPAEINKFGSSLLKHNHPCWKFFKNENEGNFLWSHLLKGVIFTLIISLTHAHKDTHRFLLCTRFYSKSYKICCFLLKIIKSKDNLFFSRVYSYSRFFSLACFHFICGAKKMIALKLTIENEVNKIMYKEWDGM